jgi:hypothetical protein
VSSRSTRRRSSSASPWSSRAVTSSART